MTAAVIDPRTLFLKTFADFSFRPSAPLSLIQPSITTSFLFSVGFVDVVEAVHGNSVELDGAVTVQRCFRHFDLDRVSDGRHLSLFEMAGALQCRNWTLSDLVSPLIRYLIDVCQLPKERLHVTYFGGGMIAGEDLELDSEAKQAYAGAGIPENQLWAGDGSTNMWFEGANSGTPRSGICGPHSEVFFDLEPESSSITDNPLSQNGRFIEISNIVKITHRAPQGNQNKLIALEQPLVELAIGMERLEMVLGRTGDVHQTYKLRAIRDALTEKGRRSEGNEASTGAIRIAVDHTRALTHLIADGARPGPKGRGHVIRRLFRRLLQACESLRIEVIQSFPGVAAVVAEVDGGINPNLTSQMEEICSVFHVEARRMLGRQ